MRYLCVFLVLLLTACSTASKRMPDGTHFTKEKFSYQAYGKDAVMCSEHAKNVRQQPVAMPANTGYAGSFTGGFLEGVSKRDLMLNAWADCLEAKGYTIGPVTEDERNKRNQAAKEYRDKFNAAQKQNGES